MTVGENIKRIRKQRGLTQSELSHIAGIHNRMLQRYENGDCIPKQDRLNTIANALEISPEILLSSPQTPGGDLLTLFRLFRSHKGKFDEHGNLVFKDSFADEIFLWYQQWKIYEQAIEDAKNIEDETERAYAIEDANDRFNFWMDTYPQSACLNRNFEEEFERFQKIKKRKRKKKK